MWLSARRSAAQWTTTVACGCSKCSSRPKQLVRAAGPRTCLGILIAKDQRADPRRDSTPVVTAAMEVACHYLSNLLPPVANWPAPTASSAPTERLIGDY